MPSLSDKVIEVMREVEKPLKAREIAARLGVRRREVNTLLYGVLAPHVTKREDHVWVFRAKESVSTKTGKSASNTADQSIKLDALSRDQRIFLVRCLKDFVFSVRVEEALSKLRLKLVADLVQVAPSRLLDLRNFGRRSLTEIEDFLSASGFELGHRIEKWDSKIARKWTLEFKNDLADVRRKQFLRPASRNARTVEEELYAFACACWNENDRNAEVTICLLGWDGSGTKTLEEVGRRYGVTRERVRQIRNAFQRRIKGRPLYLPLTQDAIDTIVRSLPSTESRMIQILQASGWISSDFDLSGLITAAEVLGIHHDVTIESFHGMKFLVPVVDGINLPRLIANSRALVSKYGCVHVETVLSYSESTNHKPNTIELVRSALSSLDDLQWLSAEKTWFTRSANTRNRLRNVIYKVMSVVPSISLGELRTAIKRVHRLGGVSPPMAILKSFCIGLDFCRVEDNRILRSHPLEPDDVLGETERMLFKVLHENGGIMAGEKLRNSCLSRGLNENTFFVYLTYSPIVTRLGKGVYALAGAHVAPGAVEVLSSKKEIRKVVEDYGWGSDGGFWILYRLNRSNKRSGVFSVPSSTTGFINGTFDISLPDGPILGKIRAQSDRLTGLKRVIRLCGGEEEDVIRIVFNLQERTAIASLVDELEIKHHLSSIPPSEDESEASEPNETYGIM